MNTTNLIVEFLVIGFQVAFWIVLIFLLIFGIDGLTPQIIKDFGTPITVSLIPICYPIGIFIDNLADFLLKKKNDKYRAEHIPDESVSISRVRTLLGGDSPLAKFLEYQRTRIRISRSSFLNFSIIAVLLPIFIITKLGFNFIWLAGLSLLLCLAVVVLAFWTWSDITQKYFRRFKEAENIIDEIKNAN